MKLEVQQSSLVIFFSHFLFYFPFLVSGNVVVNMYSQIDLKSTMPHIFSTVCVFFLVIHIFVQLNKQSMVTGLGDARFSNGVYEGYILGKHLQELQGCRMQDFLMLFMRDAFSTSI